MGEVTRLVFIRHGEARAAVEGVIAGHRGCRGLSPLGAKQAEALHGRLAATRELTADVLIASVLPRAIQTAEIIAPALGAENIEQDCDVCELHPGECDGLTYEEYDTRYRFDMLAEPERPMSPGGESIVGFRQRVRSRVRQLAETHAGKTVVLVCHGGVINAAMYGLMAAADAEPRRSVRLDPVNTSITEWTRPVSEHSEDRWLLVRYNDFAHLSFARNGTLTS